MRKGSSDRREHTCCRCSLRQAAPVMARCRAAGAVSLLQRRPIGRIHLHLQRICSKVHAAVTPGVWGPMAAHPPPFALYCLSLHPMSICSGALTSSSPDWLAATLQGETTDACCNAAALLSMCPDLDRKTFSAMTGKAPLPGRMQRLPFTKAGGTDAPYSSTSGLKALERSYTVPFWPCTTIPCSSTARLPRCLPRPVGWVALDLQWEQPCEQQDWRVTMLTCSLTGTDLLHFGVILDHCLGARPANTHQYFGEGWVTMRV